ncbi:MAG: hypothetical protein HKN92_02050 [Chitinophagales bacterium]|nr:hypothetical protein [Chitinophagales bacterium]
MKRFLSLILIAFGLFLFSCDNRSCEDVICGINENCNQGTCFCIDGYEGDNCQQLSYEKYVGNYFVNENCSPPSSSGSYNSYISWDGFNLNSLSISNFLGQGITAPAQIFTNPQNKGNLIEISFSQGLLQNVYGIGNYDENFFPPRIEIELEYTQAGQFHQCVVTYIKQ